MITEKIKYDYEREGTFSERFPILYNRRQRYQKAAKVIAVCRDFSQKPLEDLTALDLGASAALMTEYFARYFKQVIALDVDQVALKAGRREATVDNIIYLCSDGTRSALQDGSVDVIICNQVYEHVDNQTGLIAEIERLLSPDGFCYFGAGNRFVLVEGHYFLPFLSWMPTWASNLYLRLAGRKVKYDVGLLSYRRLRKLLARFSLTDYTERIIRDPMAYAALDVVQPNSFLARMPRWLFGIAYYLLPAWVWVIHKRVDDAVPKGCDSTERR
jgi:2-polyprenyl-3-methyl-5-hydroxy-6-metoxy-1,4-benzoquinol methylase